MGKLVEFKTKEREVPCLSGPARCCACRHDWVAVSSPVGTDWLECPSCHLMKGRYLHPAWPKDDEDVWICACGCDAFRIMRTEIFCINCGLRQSF